MNCPWFHLRLTLLCQHLILWCSSSDSLPSLLHPQFPPNRSSQLASKQDVIYLTLKNKKHFLTTILHFSPFRYSETIANIGLWFHFLSSCFFFPSAYLFILSSFCFLLVSFVKYKFIQLRSSRYHIFSWKHHLSFSSFPPPTILSKPLLSFYNMGWK